LVKRAFFLFLACYAVWCLLNWLPGWQALILGVPVAALAACLTWDIPIETSCLRILTPKRFWYFCTWYIPVYWWECFKANLDVAYRVLHPRLPIRPAVVRVQTGLKTDLALTVLANSISLTPGTTSIDVDPASGFLYVHCMTVSPEHVDERARVIIERFAHILRRIYE
jgi:multicomponent Na+:H+ antiporter subunit E